MNKYTSKLASIILSAALLFSCLTLAGCEKREYKVPATTEVFSVSVVPDTTEEKTSWVIEEAADIIAIVNALSALKPQPISDEELINAEEKIAYVIVLNTPELSYTYSIYEESFISYDEVTYKADITPIIPLLAKPAKK